MALLLGLGSCSDDEPDGNPQLSGLAAFLNGEFVVYRADYDGQAQNLFLGTIPLEGTGKGTVGLYNFYAADNIVYYLVNSTMEVNFFGQQQDIPIEVRGQGSIRYIDPDQFVINDPEYGDMLYQVSDQTDSNLVATTRYTEDGDQGRVDLELVIYLAKR